MSAFENRVLGEYLHLNGRKIGATLNEEFQDLYISQVLLRRVNGKSMGEVSNARRISVKHPEGKTTFETQA
jgi:hypothetical protein